MVRGNFISKAFTLLELMIVLAIIGILAGLLFPVFVSARKRAFTANSAFNMKQLALASVLYANDNNDRFPSALGANCYSLVNKFNRSCNGHNQSDVREFPSFYSVASKYIGNREVFRSKIDKMDENLARDVGRASTWWEETTFNQTLGSSYEYNGLKYDGTESRLGSDPTFMLLYSLFDDGSHSSASRSFLYMVKSDTSLTKIVRYKLGDLL
jgi:prepilin-type N-terminal cleavage/methylation domain-containing protein